MLVVLLRVFTFDHSAYHMLLSQCSPEILVIVLTNPMYPVVTIKCFGACTLLAVFSKADTVTVPGTFNLGQGPEHHTQELPEP